MKRLDISRLIADEQTNHTGPWEIGYRYGEQAHNMPDQSQPILFACPVCEQLYDTLEEATACRDTPYDDGGLHVGDIVVIPGKRAVYHDPKDPWIAFTMPADKTSPSHFDHVDMHVPYFVVTAKHVGDKNERHRCMVSVATILGGKLRVGWNPANGRGHHAMFRVSDGKRCDADSTWYNKIVKFLDKCKPSATVKKEAAQLAEIRISSRHLL